MTKPWRNTAIVLFLTALVTGGVVGEKLLAVTGETQSQLRVYTELLHLAHESYGAEDVKYRDLVYASIQGMLRTLDPHTNFLTPRSFDDMRQRQQGSFFGLGILVSMRNGQLTIISPIEGTPASRLGLRAGDVISAIEGEPTSGMSLDEAVSKLKGPKGTQVRINVARRGLAKTLDLTVTRAEIPQNTVRQAYMMEPGTGYIRLTDFSRSTASEMEEALDKLKGEGMERLILDLRGNGGGLLDQTVAVSNFFVPAGTQIVETRGRLPSSYQKYTSDGEHEPLDMPLVVLVNRGTASAAEILSGAIQDHDVGLVVGTPTWGKGLVQTVYNLSYGTGIALTTAKYYTPSGRLIQRDYSSYFDYYYIFDEEADDVTPDDPILSEDVEPELDLGHPEFTTDLGRKVYGGGGITPDAIQELPEGPDGLQGLFINNTFFNFAVDYYSRYQDQIDSVDWEPPPALLEEFKNWLVEEEVLGEEERDELFADPELGEISVRNIHSDIFNAAFGPEAANRVLARGDVQIRTALELFDEAAEMLASRHELRGGKGFRGRLAAKDDQLTDESPRQQP